MAISIWCADWYRRGRGSLVKCYPRGRYLGRLSALVIFGTLVASLSTAETSNCRPFTEGVAMHLPPHQPFGGSKRCVEDALIYRRICPSEGFIIVDFSYSELSRYNVEGRRQPQVLLEPSGCLEITLTTRPADHRGSSPNYFCSAVSWTVEVQVQECELDR
jgi:hypothetical protein